MATYTAGISVIICCYNSVRRLEPTLKALAAQRIDKSIKWEIILVDNASTDNTGNFAVGLWSGLQRLSEPEFSITSEEKPGQGHARNKGLASAKYKYIIFCDDDNWLEATYLQRAYEILHSDNTIAACGGIGYPVFETHKPDWFDEYQEAFAVGSQDIVKEDDKILNLYGAGLCINRESLIRLNRLGFDPQMVGRTGKKLSSSDDTELTYAMVLSGQKLYYSPDLKFYHFMSKERLEWEYLAKLFEAFGTDGPIRNLYYSYASKRKGYRLIRSWAPHVALSTIRLAKYYIKPPKKGGRSIYFDWNLAYLRQLFRLRTSYRVIRGKIETLQLSLDPSP